MLNCNTGLHLVVRIGQFRVQNQTELWIVFHLAIAQPHSTTFLDGVPTNDWVENWVNRLVNVLQKHCVASRYGTFDHVKVILLS